MCACVHVARLMLEDRLAARDPCGPSACACAPIRLRLRWPPLAGGAPWSPTRDHGPCEARAKELRLSLGDDAHQEEQRARLAG